MWWTPDGERILAGGEAKFFREALGVLADYVEDDEDGTVWQFGAVPFDTLQHGQKLAALAQVGTALLCEDEPMPKHTAALEAAVAVVFRIIRNMVEMEIDDPEMAVSCRRSWRQLVLDACRESGIADELPSPECDDLGEWDILIQCLQAGVLWGADWDDGDLYLDSDPEASRRLKELMRVDEDCYVNVPPDPSDKELHGVLAMLRRLTGSPLDEEDLNEEDEFVDGIEDHYHGLLIGPCDPGTAEAEAECRLVSEISVSGEDAFDCPYEEWVGHLREDVHGAARAQTAEAIAPNVSEEMTPDLADELERAQTTGLDDGTRIEARGDDWVVVDRHGFFLADPEDADWVAVDDDEDVPAAVFSSPAAAYRAWQRSEHVAESRAQRRTEALKRLGRL